VAVDVLIAIADEALRQVLEVALLMDEFLVHTATDEEEAVAALARHPPDLLLLDGTMPLSEGAVAWAERHASATPLVLLVPAWGDQPQLDRSDAVLLPMPFGRTDLRHAIAAVRGTPADQT
jgi:DNA-binding response OmpR family regulator